jgi:uncharacterized protein (TIGR03435 family)
LKLTRAIAILAGLVALAAAQSPPSFEGASVRVYPDGAPAPAGAFNGVHVIDNNTTIYSHFTRLWLIIGWAYDVTYRVLGPGWLQERVELTAKSSKPASETELRAMAQTLLAERFHLKVHRETRDFPVAVLLAAKNGPKNLRPGDPNQEPSFDRGKDGVLTYGNVSMNDLGFYSENRPPIGVSERIIDQTHITGVFNLTLSVKDFDVNDPVFSGDYEDMQRAFFDFFSSALEKQYGLKLEHRRVPLECIVVDAGTKIPAEN